MYVSRSRLAVSDNKGRSSRSMKGTTGGGGTLNTALEMSTSI